MFQLVEQKQHTSVRPEAPPARARTESSPIGPSASTTFDARRPSASFQPQQYTRKSVNLPVDVSATSNPPEIPRVPVLWFDWSHIRARRRRQHQRQGPYPSTADIRPM